MKSIKIFFFVISFLISGVLMAQQPVKEVKKDQTNTQNKEKKTQQKIKTVPKSNIQKKQVKKATQIKSKAQHQKLKKAIRRNHITRKPMRRKG